MHGLISLIARQVLVSFVYVIIAGRRSCDRAPIASGVRRYIDCAHCIPAESQLGVK